MLHFGSRQLLWDFPFLVNATFLKRKPIGLSQIGRQGSRKELSKSYPFSEWYNALRSLNAERKAVFYGGIKTKTYIPTKPTTYQTMTDERLGEDMVTS